MKKATAKVFATGRSQAIRLPKAFRFDTDEVFIERKGGHVILTPKPKSWQQYFDEGKRFSADFPERIEDVSPEEREAL